MTNSKVKKVAWILTSMMAAGIFMLSTSAIVRAEGLLSVYGTDTIAGYSALLSTSKTSPNQEVVFSVKKPDGSVINVSAVTDKTGVARVDLYDYHTRKAGKYELYGVLNGSGNRSASSYFTVYADKVSVERSSIGANKGLAKAGGDEVYVTVTVVDRYGNAFKGHVINLISSRAEDRIQAKSIGALTDVNGSATFSVSSNNKGMSVYSAVNSTTGDVLSDRVQVAYLTSSEFIADAGGYFDSFIPVANAAGQVDHFKIDVPDAVEPGETVSFTVTAVTAEDMGEETVVDYVDRTVHFSAEGDNSNNVNLPADYEFTKNDEGKHTFDLILSFTTAGTYKIVATDVDDSLIKGETTVVVVGDGGPQPSGGETPVLSSPTSGSYSQNVQTIGGVSQPGLSINIFDNDQEIGSVQADLSGNFAFQTAPLADGVHEIYVVALDDADTVIGTSATINITIDTTAPVVDDVTLEPGNEVNAGETLTVKVLSEENLSQSAIIFNFDIAELVPSLDVPGTYVASVQAPAEPGVYAIDIVLVDELGNEATYQESTSVTILAAGEMPAEPAPVEEVAPPEEVIPVEEDANLPPSQVFGVIAYGSDDRVTLVWEAASDDVLVDHYKVYYGTDPANLDDAVDTLDASITWYVPNLENGVEYYFAINAVDDLGAESADKSEIVSGIPFSLELEAEVPERPIESLALSPEEEALLRGAAIEAIPPEMVKNGPEMIWLLFGTGALSAFARRLSRRKKIK